MKKCVVGIGGRSGSGKSTLVKKLLHYFGPDIITLHTMDNYYLPRNQQYKDDHNYLNFDLPDSFYKNNFVSDLSSLLNDQEVIINEYQFNNKTSGHLLKTIPAPVILVEGLFVFHYSAINHLMNLKVLVDISFEEAYRRRLLRDQNERNYTVEEIHYRYMNHVEPSFQKYISPHVESMDMIVNNELDMENDLGKLKNKIESLIKI